MNLHDKFLQALQEYSGSEEFRKLDYTFQEKVLKLQQLTEKTLTLPSPTNAEVLLFNESRFRGTMLYRNRLQAEKFQGAGLVEPGALVARISMGR